MESEPFVKSFRLRAKTDYQRILSRMDAAPIARTFTGHFGADSEATAPAIDRVNAACPTPAAERSSIAGRAASG